MYINLEEEVQNLKKIITHQKSIHLELHNKLIESNRKIQELQNELRLQKYYSQNHISVIYKSNSWKITAPCRRIKSTYIKIKEKLF